MLITSTFIINKLITKFVSFLKATITWNKWEEADCNWLCVHHYILLQLYQSNKRFINSNTFNISYPYFPLIDNKEVLRLGQIFYITGNKKFRYYMKNGRFLYVSTRAQKRRIIESSNFTLRLGAWLKIRFISSRKIFFSTGLCYEKSGCIECSKLIILYKYNFLRVKNRNFWFSKQVCFA